MTTVGGTLSQPGLVTFFLVDQDGLKVHDAFIAGGTIVGETYVQTDAAGVYTVSLAGNADIQADATATYWVRGFGLSHLTMMVPTSGTWNELQIAADPPPSSPNPVATNLLGSAEITTAVSGLAAVAFPPVFPTVTGTTYTLADLAYQVELRGKGAMLCPATANITVGLAIFRVADSFMLDIDYQPLTVANLPTTCRPIAIVPPHSSGDYQLRVYSFTNATLTVDASPSQKAGIWAYAV